MAATSIFDAVKGFLSGGRGVSGPNPNRSPRRGGGHFYLPPPPPPDPDALNPASIVRVGRSTDDRELIMTLGFGAFLLDREAPSICAYQNGGVALVPTPTLQELVAHLMEKKMVGAYANQYIDLLNVANHELAQREARRRASGGRPSPPPPPKAPPRAPLKPGKGQALWPDEENPATILRVGRSAQGGELIMTLGLGTFVLHREPPNLMAFDRGREWEVGPGDLRLLVEALMAKQNTGEHAYTYVDLLNVAMMLQERKRAPQAPKAARQGGKRGR